MLTLGETVGGRFHPFCLSLHSFSQITKQLRQAKKMPGFPTQGVGTPTNRGKARRYVQTHRDARAKKMLG
jgi:hypothetical protein